MDEEQKKYRDEKGRWLPGVKYPGAVKPKGPTIERLTRDMLNKTDPVTGQTKLEMMVEKFIQDAIQKGWTKSGNLIIERAFGKVADKVIFQETDNLLSDEEVLDMFEEEDFEKYENKLSEIRSDEESSTDGDIAS